MVTLKQALLYERLGFSLVPITPKRKLPMRRLLPEVDGKPSWKPYLVERATKEVIKSWYKRYPRLNMAVACGPVSGGLVVIDFDIDAEQYWREWVKMTAPLSHALPVARTGKGLHVYLRYAQTVPSIQLAQKENGRIIVETRGHGGLCMLPPSTHPEGHTYIWKQGSAEQIPIVNHRQYLRLVGVAVRFHECVDKVVVPAVAAPAATDTQSLVNPGVMQKRLVAYGMAVLLNLQSELAGIGQGGRNAGLNRSSYIVGRYVGAGLVVRDVAHSMLRQACLDNGYIYEDGENAFLRTFKSGLDAGIARPVDVGELSGRLRGNDRGKT